jgi:hypothetical protein
MTAIWRYLGSEGQDLGASDPFEDRQTAEEWMGEAWSALLKDGVEEVGLEEDGREIYRMGLREA